MNLYITCVHNKKKAKNAPGTPGIIFYAEWTRTMGFVPDALVQFIPEPGGAKFLLCNENISSYSALVQRTAELGGVLVHAKMYKHKDFPCLAVSGEVMEHTGLAIGDNLIARFEYGLVHLRRIPPGPVRVVTAGWVSGQWLLEYDFEPDSVLTVAAEPGIITCELQLNGLKRTAELVKHARLNDLGLIQVRRVADSRVVIPLIEIPTSRLAKAGIVPDDTLLATYKHGRIQLQKLDLIALGFD